MESVRENYLATEVRTATPQKLHLMLIEAALRSAERARQQIAAKENDWALGSIVHAQAVMSELLAGIDHQSGDGLTKNVSALYDFVFRSLVEAGRSMGEKPLADAIRILEIERETWRQVCDKIAAETPSEHRWDSAAPHAAPPPVLPPLASDFESLGAGGFSIEA